MAWTRKRALFAALIFALLAGALLFLLLRGSPAGETPPAPPQGLNRYALSLRLNPEEKSLAVSEALDFHNDTGDTLTTLVLHTWLNAYQTEETSPAALEELYDSCYPAGFSPGYLALYDVLWNGERAAWAYLDAAETALEISIPALAPGEGGRLELRCVAYLPHCAHRTGYTGDTFQLGQTIPLLSRYENGAWRTDAYAPVGDPFVNDCADFSLSLSAPQGYVPICSAPLTQDAAGTWRGEIAAARELGLCVSGEYQCAQAQAGNIRLLAYAREEAAARRMLRYARQALETFQALYGAYPYASYTLCQADFPFGGMEYAAFALIGGDYLAEGRQDSLELILAHETAHQWFYALVGSDQWNQPWQDEALCEYAMLRYVRARYGQGSFETLRHYRVDEPLREALPALTPASPLDYFSTLHDYTAVVYGRGAALALALEEALPGGVDASLRAYVEKFAFAYVSRADFEDFLCQYAGMDLRPLLLDYLDTLM